MKTLSLTTLACILSFSVFSINPNTEKAEQMDVIKSEANLIVKDLFKGIQQSSKEEQVNLKIIIFNNNFRKVRVERIESMKDINQHSTLVPVIYRSELITKIGNVSYYMLKE